MLRIREAIRQAIAKRIEARLPHAGSKVDLENPKVAEHGDYACTAAMQVAKALGRNPRELAQELIASLQDEAIIQEWVESMEIAGPGFINIRLLPKAKQEAVRTILQEQERYGVQASTGKKIIVEFVSANPTGPLHVGHGRQAALGDAISKLYETQGWQVHREFYYNDAGVQIHNLALSVQARARGVGPGDESWPESAYNGEYIQDIARAFLDKVSIEADDRHYTASGEVDNLDDVRQFAVAYLRHEQDLDLRAFNLHFDQYFLESSLYSEGMVEKTVERLQQNGLTYEEGGALWLRSTDFGDDKDRVMRKSDGSYTYFVPDVAYHHNKWERGFDKAVNIQGSDHHGTIARVRAGLQGLEVGIAPGYPDYVLHTMVRVVRGGEEVKLSKRAGSYVTLRDVIEWTSKDAVRFFLLSRKPDTEYTFDIDLALAKDNENPVYYVQYAHARICSVLAAWGGEVESLAQADLDGLTHPSALKLMVLLSKYPAMLSAAAKDFAPHDVTFYLRELAGAYHSYYDAERILVEDETTKLARLALIQSCAQVIKNGLGLLGVSAPEKM